MSPPTSTSWHLMLRTTVRPGPHHIPHLRHKVHFCLRRPPLLPIQAQSLHPPHPLHLLRVPRQFRGSYLGASSLSHLTSIPPAPLPHHTSILQLHTQLLHNHLQPTAPIRTSPIVTSPAPASPLLLFPQALLLAQHQPPHSSIKTVFIVLCPAVLSHFPREEVTLATSL